MGWRAEWQPVLSRIRNYRERSRSWRGRTSCWWRRSISYRSSLLRPPAELPRPAPVFWYHQEFPYFPLSHFCHPPHFHLIPALPSPVLQTVITNDPLFSMPPSSLVPKSPLAPLQILLFSLALIILPSFSPFQGQPEARSEGYQLHGVISRNILTHEDMTESAESPVLKANLEELPQVPATNGSTKMAHLKMRVKARPTGPTRGMVHADEM